MHRIFTQIIVLLSCIVSNLALGQNFVVVNLTPEKNPDLRGAVICNGVETSTPAMDDHRPYFIVNTLLKKSGCKPNMALELQAMDGSGATALCGGNIVYQNNSDIHYFAVTKDASGLKCIYPYHR